MESILKDGIMNHLTENGLLTQTQQGFMPGRSCTTNLLEFFEHVTRTVDEGCPMDVIFLDFAKAFHKVPRNRLMEKLRAHGVIGETWAWIMEWLSSRKQRVVINGRASSWIEVLSGVPKGSVLGPLLFLVFTNDLDEAVPGLELLRKFADDTKMGHKAKTQQEREQIQEALDGLCDWASKWGMQFNVAKCKVLHVGHGNAKMEYKMEGQALKTVVEETDVGVLVRDNLKPSAQCARAAKTAQAVLGQLIRAFHYRDRHIFMRLYCQYVRPHLEFAVPAWSPWSAGDKEILEKVQARAVGMVSGLRGVTYSERLVELGMTTLEERRHQLDMIQTWKIIHRKDNVNPESWFQKTRGEARTRAAADPLNLRIPVARLEVRKHFFSQRVPEEWNKIPAELKGAATVSGFRKGYRQYRQNTMLPRN
jgi:hypothetical protein